MSVSLLLMPGGRLKACMYSFTVHALRSTVHGPRQVGSLWLARPVPRPSPMLHSIPKLAKPCVAHESCTAHRPSIDHILLRARLAHASLR